MSASLGLPRFCVPCDSSCDSTFTLPSCSYPAIWESGMLNTGDHKTRSRPDPARNGQVLQDMSCLSILRGKMLVYSIMRYERLLPQNATERPLKDNIRTMQWVAIHLRNYKLTHTSPRTCPLTLCRCGSFCFTDKKKQQNKAKEEK